MRPIPITGVAALNALGGRREAHVSALFEGRSGLDAPSLALPFKTVVGEVRIPLEPLDGPLGPWDTRLARMVALLLSELDAPLERLRARTFPERIGIFLGTSTAGALTTERAYARYLREGVLPPEYDYEKQHTFGAVLHVVRALTGAAGPGWVVSTACTSSAKTAGSAARMIEAGFLDAAIVGGVDTLCEMTLRGFGSLSALSDRPCRPFSAAANGINIGEGGALFLMARSGEPIGLIEGIGESSDAYHVSAPHPEGTGAKLAMERALPAGVTPKDVDHVNAHGTGTTHNDRMESRAIRELLGPEVPVISTKGYTGHTLGGAGATEIAFSLWMMAEGFIAPSLGAEPPHPELGIHVVTERLPARLGRVLSNSFAFGGNNISVCLRAP